MAVYLCRYCHVDRHRKDSSGKTRNHTSKNRLNIVCCHYTSKLLYQWFHYILKKKKKPYCDNIHVQCSSFCPLICFDIKKGAIKSLQCTSHYGLFFGNNQIAYWSERLVDFNIIYSIIHMWKHLDDHIILPWVEVWACKLV